MSQIIIIESAEALAEQIEQTMSLFGVKDTEIIAKVKNAVRCLHPIEVPSDDMEGLIDKLERLLNMDDDIYPPDNRCEAAAALITAHERVVPRAMLEEVWIHGHDYAFDKTISANIDKIIEKFGYRAE